MPAARNLKKESRSILSYFTPGRQPREGQKLALERIEKEWNQKDVFVIEMPTGCHAKGQGILLYDGKIRLVEDIQVGDLLMGPDSTPRRVTALHRGRQKMARITPIKGESFTVNMDHILSLIRTNSYTPGIKRRKDVKDGAIVNISVEDYLKTSNTFKHLHKLYRTGVDFSATPDLLIPPYILGVWLGDGNSDGPGVTTADSEIEQEWRNWATRFPGHHITLHHKQDNLATTFYIKSPDRKNLARQQLVTLGVLNNKHIPHSYLTASFRDRAELLAGLIDTDGSLSRAGFDFIQKNQVLANQVVYLARSLGLAAYLKLCRKKDQNGAEDTYARVSISGDTNLVPVKIKRKMPPARLQKKSVLRTGFQVTELPEDEYYGFEVDKDHLYLLADFTVTHNSGKSDLALTVARWASAQYGQKGMILVPNNVLLQQYLDGNPRLATIRAKQDYVCAHGTTELLGEMSCKEYSQRVGHTCKGVCPYTAANRKIRAVPYGVVNYYTYLAHRLYPDVLVVDEAHNLLGMLREFAAKKLWQHQYHYPEYIRDYSGLLRWVREKRKELEEEGQEPDSKLELLFKDLTGGAPKYLVERAVEPHFGNDKPLLKLLPIDTSDQPPLLWPGQVRKLILLSATFGRKDLEQLGLDRRRVSWIATPSPIPAAQRPIQVQEPGIDLSYSGVQKNLPDLLKSLHEIADKHTGQRGIVHTTYSLMQELDRMGIIQEGGRFLIHNRQNKKEKYQEFLTGSSDAILICAGLYEGIDLPGDLGRFQVITKVPWPSLAEPAWKYLAEQDRDRYCYETLKTVMQGAGRVCRTPTDYGITYILDRTFQNIPRELMPSWFIQALEAGVENV